MRSLRILVCGSRDWTDEDRVRDVLTTIPRDRVIVSGGAPGADSIAANIAGLIGFTVEVFPADWSQGKRGGAMRNRQMLDSGIDGLVAFITLGPSRGTGDCVGEAIKRGIRCKLVYQ